MSIRHLTFVWEDPYYLQADKAKLLVALAIADSARSEDGRAWPSIDSIAKKARTSARSVQDACRQLEQDGKLKVEIGASEYGTNIYTVEMGGAAIAPCNGAAEEAAPRCTQSVRNGKEPKSNRLTSPGKAVSQEGLAFADWFRSTLSEDVQLKGEWRKLWAKTYDDLIRLDHRTKARIFAVCRWARENEFWRSNFMSPAKLREKKDGITYFDRFVERIKAPGQRAETKPDHAAGF